MLNKWSIKKSLLHRQISKTNATAGKNFPTKIHFGEERGILKGERIEDSEWLAKSVTRPTPLLLKRRFFGSFLFAEEKK